MKTNTTHFVPASHVHTIPPASFLVLPVVLTTVPLVLETVTSSKRLHVELELVFSRPAHHLLGVSHAFYKPAFGVASSASERVHVRIRIVQS